MVKWCQKLTLIRTLHHYSIIFIWLKLEEKFHSLKAPKKVTPWDDILDAFNFGNDCIQINPNNNTIFGTEDCLYLNIYVPTRSKQSANVKLPVIFYIFGGQFNFGSSSFYGPDFIMDTNVILVRRSPFISCTLNLM